MLVGRDQEAKRPPNTQWSQKLAFSGPVTGFSTTPRWETYLQHLFWYILIIWFHYCKRTLLDIIVVIAWHFHRVFQSYLTMQLAEGTVFQTIEYDFWLFWKLVVDPRLAIWAHLPVFKWQLSGCLGVILSRRQLHSGDKWPRPVSTPGNFGLW